MTGYGIMLATDDDLRAEISSSAKFDAEYREMVQALAARDALHAAIDHITGTRWTEVRPNQVPMFDDCPTAA